MDTIALESYTIEFANHMNGVIAQEGFFMDDKNAKITYQEDPEGKINVGKYKKYSVYTMGPKYARAFADSFTKVAKGFVTKGPKYMQTAIRELKALQAYVEKNNADFVEAMKSGNTERAKNIANGIGGCVPTIIDTNRRWNRGDRDFVGEGVEVSDALRKQIEKFATEFTVIYNAALKNVSNIKVKEYISKSTLKKLFKNKSLQVEGAAKLYMWNEFKLYCEDVMDYLTSAKQ